MGDVAEACQVIILCGKMVLQLKNVTVAAAVRSAQVMNTIYMAKWKGSTSYRRLLNIKGEESGLVFVNIGIEEDSVHNTRMMKGIKKELKDHGILFAELPDLCGGDGNTQICVSAKDAQKLAAMMMSHMNGKYREVPIAEISQFDYTATAQRADGSPTPEFDILLDSAAETMREQNVPVLTETEVLPEKIPVRKRLKEQEVKAVKVKKTLKAPGEAGYAKKLLKPEAKQEEKDTPFKAFPDPVFSPEAGNEWEREFEGRNQNKKPAVKRKRRRSVKSRIGATITDFADYITGRGHTGSTKEPGYALDLIPKAPELPKKVLAQMITEYENGVLWGENSATWLEQSPVLSKEIRGNKYHLFSLPDGEKGIIVPDSAYRESERDLTTGYYFGKRGAYVCEGRDYYAVDYKTGAVSILDGRDALKEARKTPVESYAAKAEKLMQDAKQKALLGDKITSVVRGKR